jgi:hypothetical protein
MQCNRHDNPRKVLKRRRIGTKGFVCGSNDKRCMNIAKCHPTRSIMGGEIKIQLVPGTVWHSASPNVSRYGDMYSFCIPNFCAALSLNVTNFGGSPETCNIAIQLAPQ